MKKEMIYKERRYSSISELCRDLNLPYYKVYKTLQSEKDIPIALERIKNELEQGAQFYLWKKRYESLDDIAIQYGVRFESLSTRVTGQSNLESVIIDLLYKESIFYKGYEYENIIDLAQNLGKPPEKIIEELKWGYSLEDILNCKVGRKYKEGFSNIYNGKEYDSVEQLLHEKGITRSVIYNFIKYHNLEMREAIDILIETKKRVGIPENQKMSQLPTCKINGRYYEDNNKVAEAFGFTKTALSKYKSRNGYKGVLSALRAMQKETIEVYVVNGERKRMVDLLEMGYTYENYKNVPKKRIPLYPQLENIDLYTDCIDIRETFEEVKREYMEAKDNEFVEEEQGMQMNM